MKIRVNGYFEFHDKSDCCHENGDLSILYEVPMSWSNWSNEKKEKWLIKNEDRIDKQFQDAMCVVALIPDVAEIEEEIC